MALSVYFAPKGMTAEKYDAVIERLAEAGAAAPEGRSYHCAFAAGEDVHVVDVWDSQEAFDAAPRSCRSSPTPASTRGSR